MASQIVLIIIGVVIVGLLLVLLLKQKTREQVVGICANALDQTVRKNANKEKILELLVKIGEASNSDIREALKISERTAVRYMDELEREEKVEQVGSTGRGVIYRAKQ